MLAGLGNPGPGHAGNRHNIGFMAADAVRRAHDFGAFREKFHGETAAGRVGAFRVHILKPMTYMNESGRSVRAAADFLKIPAENIWVFHDEIDLAPGKVRVKRGGGHAGHNGLRDIHAAEGPDYNRVRIGVGHPGAKDRVMSHVLNDFSKADMAWVEPLVDALARHAELLFKDRDSEYMSRIAAEAPPPAPPASPAPEKENGGA
ncbi:MAG: aminoacyl-tRNA hydrolase [Rhodospirillales bacterium]